MDIMTKDIEQALTNFRVAAGRYAKTERYYDGNHNLAFATEKFQNAFGTLFREFALNLCPVICDAVRDKLRITGFSVEEPGARAFLPERGVSPADASDGDGDHTRAGSPRSDSRRIW